MKGPAFDLDALRDLLPAYLGRQRWFSGAEPEKVEIEDDELLHERLLWLLVDADGARYQLLVGGVAEGPGPEFLHGHEPQVIGVAAGRLLYDGLLDPELAVVVLQHVTPDEQVTHVRPMGAEQSNTSVVFDERLVLKVFRRVHDGPNPDVEVPAALARVGYTHVPTPLGVWERDERHLAVVQPFLVGASDGWLLALASLRDLFGGDCDDPAECGGDFGAEAARLADVTGRMHLALADAFGRSDGDATVWAATMEAQLERVARDRPWFDAAKRIYAEFRALPSAGAAIRVHGDYHLGQVVRADTGWFVLDFEGEPARPVAERRMPTSPLKDVAGMVRSLDYAVVVALRERGEAEFERCKPLGRAWEMRNRAAFLDGYFAVDGIEALLPSDPHRALLAWELDKAVYEIAYEAAHRPDWVAIPEEAVLRLIREEGG